MLVINATTLERLPDHPDLGTTGTATIVSIARLNNPDRDNMVAIGYGAGNVSSGGSGTILIGANVQAPDATAQNQLNIGNWIYGNDGKIGIGTASPVATLHLSDGNTATSSLITSDKLLFSYQNTSAGIAGLVASDTAGTRPVFKGTRSRGTLANPTGVYADDDIFTWLSAAFD